MSEHIVSVQHLSCKVGNRYLLKDINWQIKRGDNWILFGLNGCGKTTLLSVIAGYKASLQGEVAVFGEHYTEENWQALRRRIALGSVVLFLIGTIPVSPCCRSFYLENLLLLVLVKE